jgi:hypothetical protein
MSILSIFGQGYDYSTSNYAANSSVSGESYAMGPGFFLFVLAVAVVSYVIVALFLGRIFKKAGIASWKAWVPIYNSWIVLEMGGQKGYWAVVALIPLVNIVAAVFMIIAMYNIGLKFGKSSAFVLLAIFLPLVWVIWLASDSSKWKGPKVTS